MANLPENFDVRHLSPLDLIQLMLTTSRELDEAQQELRKAGIQEATTANDYRKAAATSMLSLAGMNAPDGKRLAVAEKEARAELAVGDLHLKKDLAEVWHRAMQESVRNKRQQLSALQSISGAVRAEAELLRTGPQMEP